MSDEKPSLREYAVDQQLSQLAGNPPIGRPSKKSRNQHPVAGISWKNSTEGVITSPPSQDRDVRWDELLQEWGLNPDEYEIVEPVSISCWDGFIKNQDHQIETVTLWSKKAGVRRRVSSKTDEDLQKILEELDLRRPLVPWNTEHEEDRALVVTFSDWQLGKGEGGGTEKSVERILASFSRVYDRILESEVKKLVVLGVGDIIEGCDNHYPMQTFQTDLDRRGQCTVARRLILKALLSWASVVEEIVVACIPGNHGENRREGKAFTTFGDNDDIAVFEQVKDALEGRPEMSHVSFLIPKNELAISLDVYGTIIGVAHGHQSGVSGTDAQKKIKEWWGKMAFTGQPVGDASILFTGHYHHLSIVQHGDRTHFQSPSMDGGSEWYENKGGDRSIPGMLTVVVDKNGWDRSSIAIL